VRLLFQRKHTVYVFLFIAIWIFKLSASYFQLFNPSNKNNPPTPKNDGDDPKMDDYYR
jgi:hypothetical protein